MSTFTQRMRIMEKPAIAMRELFSSINDPELIAFGGGAPAKEALPIDIVREITNDIMRTDKRGVEALQYGSIRGCSDLCEVIVNDLLVPKGIKGRVESLLITSGGIEAINLLC